MPLDTLMKKSYCLVHAPTSLIPEARLLEICNSEISPDDWAEESKTLNLAPRVAEQELTITEDNESPGLLPGSDTKLSAEVVLELLLESHRSEKAVPARKKMNMNDMYFIC